MNALTQFAQDHPELEVMNVLQDAGIVSDNCITTEDVAEADVDRAVTYLKLEMA